MMAIVGGAKGLRRRLAAAMAVALAVGVTSGMTALPAGAQSRLGAAEPVPVKFSPDLSGHADFGFAVSVDDDTAVIGAPNDDAARPSSGSVGVRGGRRGLDRAGEAHPRAPRRVRQFRLFRNCPERGHRGDRRAVQQRRRRVLGGTAYVFVRSGSTWTEQARLVPSVIENNGNAGWSVAVQGDLAVVGVPGGVSGRGAVSIFQRSGATWAEVAVLQDESLESIQDFGISVAIDGDTLAIGQSWSYGDEERNSLYIYVGSGASWTQQAVLGPDDQSDLEASFANSVDVDGDIVVATATGADVDGARDAGAAYVYDRDGTTWTEVARLTVAEATTLDGFGDSVAVDGRLVAVGAYGYRGDGSEFTGAVAVFRRGSDEVWTQRRLLVPPDGDEERFGFAVDLDKRDAGGRSLLVGAPYGGSGRAYLYQW